MACKNQGGGRGCTTSHRRTKCCRSSEQFLNTTLAKSRRLSDLKLLSCSRTKSCRQQEGVEEETGQGLRCWSVAVRWAGDARLQMRPHLVIPVSLFD
jgi:hypothetical protein